MLLPFALPALPTNETTTPGRNPRRLHGVLPWCPRCAPAQENAEEAIDQSIQYECLQCGHSVDLRELRTRSRPAPMHSPAMQLALALGVTVDERAVVDGAPVAASLNIVSAEHRATSDGLAHSYAVVLENPSPEMACENSTAAVDLCDTAGHALARDFALLSLVLPGQRVALAGAVRTVGIPSYLDVRLTCGGSARVPGQPALSPTKGICREDGVAIANIRNPYPFRLEALYVAVLARDKAGRFVAAGSKLGPALPAAGSRDIAVPLGVASAVASEVVFYPSLSPLSFHYLRTEGPAIRSTSSNEREP